MIYQFRCPRCERVEDRICAVGEREGQFCKCGWPMVYEFVPTRMKATIDHRFGGPKHKARMLRDRGLIEIGNERPDAAAKRTRQQIEEREAREVERAVGELALEVGETFDRAVESNQPGPIINHVTGETFDPGGAVGEVVDLEP